MVDWPFHNGGSHQIPPDRRPTARLTPPWPTGDPWDDLAASPRLGLETFDPEGNLVTMNEAARDRFGVAGDLPRYNVFESQHVHPAVKQSLRAGLPYVEYLRFDPERCAFSSTSASPVWSAVAILPRGAEGFLALYGDAG